jgi:Type ISP C-terminal specificity domain
MSAQLRSILHFDDLLAYLADQLDWPISNYKLDELTFEYDADELGLKPEEAAKLRGGKIRQLRPLQGALPWGIFFVEFQNAKLPVVVLRRILSHLALKKRASANAAEAKRWQASDLLFISAFGENDDREMAFAHFHKDPDTTELPLLRVLGWDGTDTPLKLEHVGQVLKNRLHWPENSTDHAAWKKQWTGAFRHRPGHTIKTASELAEALAVFARKIRTAVITVMGYESETSGQLFQLYGSFKSALVADLSEEDFADTYSQTITYGLLTAAFRRTPPDAGAMAPHEQTAITQDDITLLTLKATSPFLHEMLQEFLRVGGRAKGLDFDELGINEVVALLNGNETDIHSVKLGFNRRKPGEDPVIHFYEHFLAAYNKKIKIKRGVFYTPQSVVSYIVRSVHELLQTEFGLADGLADTTTWGEMLQKHPDLILPDLSDDPDRPKLLPESEPFVQILDPATGTATFLVEVIDLIHRHLQAKWKTHRAGLPSLASFLPIPTNFVDYWNLYVPACLLPRLHAFELMMAPYAIAHMKIGLKLAETGYKFATEERARIYLTNALEPKLTQLPVIGFEALAHEAAAVNEIKWHKRFSVIIGNPPYSPSICEPDWLMRRLDDWKQGLNEAKSDLNREEWKFLRFAQHHCQTTGAGIIGFIINRDFLDGIVKRRMREHLAQSFPLRMAVDLNGDVKGNISDENVFEIEQGVTIAVLCTKSAKQVLRFASRVGTKVQKYADLFAKKPIDSALTEFEPTAPYFRWQPSASTTAAGAGDEYAKWMPLDTVFALKSSGIQTKNDPICIGWSPKEIFKRVERLAMLNAEEARAEFELDGEGAWTLANAQADLRQFGISRKNVRRILYRPLDFRFTYYTHKSSGFLGRPRYDLMRHMVDGRNIGLIFNRQIVGDSVSHFSVSRDLTCHGTFYLGNKGQDYLAPLFLQEDDLLSKPGVGGTPNFTSAFTASLHATLGRPGPKLTPEDIFHYIYAVFHSPGYRNRYAEFLKIDFPRLPLTGNLELFRTLSRLGGELTALHLLESPKLDQPLTKFIGGKNPEVEKPTWTDDTVWVDKKQTTGFQGVPEAVWNFHIGGYQVCHKWLKDRKGRTLSAEDIAHYHKIVIALTETIRLMAEIDQVIEIHGGWPGAFQTATSHG